MFVCSLCAFIELAIILKMYNGEFDHIQLHSFSLYSCYLVVTALVGYLLFLGIPELMVWIKRETGICGNFNLTNPRVQVFEDAPGLSIGTK